MKSIARPTVRESVVEALRAPIVDGEWPLGFKIPSESKLMGALGVSRTALRESIRGLAETGLLESRQGVGTFVVATSEAEGALRRRLRDAELDEVTELRRGLDLVAAGAAALRRSESQLALLKESLSARSEAALHGHEDAFVLADVDFHLGIARASGNRLLTEVYENLSFVLTDSVKGSQCFAGLSAHGDQWHELLYKAIVDQDSLRAGEIALHLVNSA